MKLTLTRADLLKALEPAQRIVERRTTIPVLGNVLLAARGGTLLLRATDLDCELTAPCVAQVETEGALTVPAVRLYDIVRKLPDGASLTLEAAGDGHCKLRSGRSRFSLLSLPESDFPDITAGEMTHHFAMEPEALKEIIAATSFAICADQTRYYLNGIHLHAGEADGAPILAAVATDSHRLARYHAALPEGAGDMPAIIVPRQAVGEIARLVDKAKESVQVALSATKIRVTVEGVEFRSKLIDGTFPDYQRILPRDNHKLATIDAEGLARAVDRVSSITGGRRGVVKLALADRTLTLSVVNPDSGTAREEIEADYDGEPIEIGFNARYVGDALAAIGGDTVLLKLGDAGSPAIIQAREGASLLTVLMPMRV